MCDANSVGRTSGYIALDWDQTTLQLKYQSALERVSSSVSVLTEAAC